jgi:NTP pyrophosphatase (non-canonical NTP hydrolase)
METELDIRFATLVDEIHELNKLEPKTLPIKIIKYGEEWGELMAEIIKAMGESPKPYSKKDLTSEMADVLQMVLLIYDNISRDYEITLTDVFTAMKIKNEKWRTNIPKYQNNLI